MWFFLSRTREDLSVRGEVLVEVEDLLEDAVVHHLVLQPVEKIHLVLPKTPDSTEGLPN